MTTRATSTGVAVDNSRRTIDQKMRRRLSRPCLRHGLTQMNPANAPIFPLSPSGQINDQDLNSLGKLTVARSVDPDHLTLYVLPRDVLPAASA